MVDSVYDAEALDSFRKSGLIIAKLRKEIPSIVKPGKPALKICVEIESRIRELGGKPAFPVNIGINEIAAHYTSPPGDTLTIPSGSMVKVDFGVHVNGYVTDTAVTVFYDPKFEPMVKAADDALQNAIKALRGGSVRYRALRDPSRSCRLRHEHVTRPDLSLHQIQGRQKRRVQESPRRHLHPILNHALRTTLACGQVSPRNRKERHARPGAQQVRRRIPSPRRGDKETRRPVRTHSPSWAG